MWVRILYSIIIPTIFVMFTDIPYKWNKCTSMTNSNWKEGYQQNVLFLCFHIYLEIFFFFFLRNLYHLQDTVLCAIQQQQQQLSNIFNELYYFNRKINLYLFNSMNSCINRHYVTPTAANHFINDIIFLFYWIDIILSK